MTTLRKEGAFGIVAGDVLRRLIARTTAQQLGPAVNAATGPHQYALSTRAGCKYAAHALQVLTELYPETTNTSIDGISVCDAMSRRAMFEEFVNVVGGSAVVPFAPVFFSSPPAFLGNMRKVLCTRSTGGGRKLGFRVLGRHHTRRPTGVVGSLPASSAARLVCLNIAGPINVGLDIQICQPLVGIDFDAATRVHSFNCRQQSFAGTSDVLGQNTSGNRESWAIWSHATHTCNGSSCTSSLFLMQASPLLCRSWLSLVMRVSTSLHCSMPHPRLWPTSATTNCGHDLLWPSRLWTRRVQSKGGWRALWPSKMSRLRRVLLNPKDLNPEDLNPKDLNPEP